MALKSKKFSSEVDSIAMVFYQRIIPYILPHIAYIFIITIEQGYIPDRWKSAILIPILKKHKNPVQPNSYRPLYITLRIVY